MELIGQSSLWVEKYRPKTVKDLILPSNIAKLFNKFVAEGDIPNLLFSSSAGRGKTSTANALIHDLECDHLYINGSVENSIDTLRYKVTQFAMTSSFTDNGKICFIDECERLSPNAQDGMKALIEQTESNCRFILTTNNMSKIIDPIKSRCQLIDFNFDQSEMKNLVIAYFKRLCFVLESENVKYDKQVLATFIQKMYPDFRKTMNELQKFSKMHGEVSHAIFHNLAGSQFTSLVEEIKNKRFNSARKIIPNIDPAEFYNEFYTKLDDLIVDESKPSAVLIIGEWAYKHSLTVAPETALCACITELMRECKFK